MAVTHRPILLAALAAALLAAPARAQGTVTPTPGGGVTINFVDTDLRSAVQALAPYLDRPVTFGSVGAARINFFSPRPVPPSDVPGVLRTLLDGAGHELVADGTVYRIQQKAQAAPQLAQPPQYPRPMGGGTSELQLFVIRLHHARAADVAATVNALYGRSSALGEIGDRRQTLANQIRDSRLQPVGADPQVVQPGGGARGAVLASELVMVPDERTNSLLVRATPGDFALIQQAVNEVDVRPLQVLIEATIAEVSRNSSFALSLSASSDTSPVRGVRGITASGQTTAPRAPGGIAVQVMGIGGGDINVLLEAAASRGEVTIINRPVVLAANNETAHVLVGDQVPFVQIERSLPTDNAIRDKVVQYRDVGTELEVRPTISTDGYVMLEVTQQVNSLGALSGVADAPIISTRSVDTKLLVRDGQTAVLGGISASYRSNARTGVPFLSQIPLVGWIFGGNHREGTNTELFLFLTPRVIRDDASMDSAAAQVRTSSPRVDRAMSKLRPIAGPQQPKGQRRPAAPAQPPAPAPVPAPAPAQPQPTNPAPRED